MGIIELFVRRPVLAIIVSLAIVIVGLRSLTMLPIQQYPQTESAVVTITTIYYGADPSTVAGFITTPIEQAIAQVDGIDYMTSTSQTGVSTITANLDLNYDSRAALSDISTRVNAIINQLPTGTLQPAVTVANSTTVDAMYIGFYSEILQPNQITDYIIRVVKPQIETISGIQAAELLGAQNFAMRAWLDPRKLAAHSMTAADVANALSANNYISGLGGTKGNMVQALLSAETGLHSLDEFRNLIIRESGGAIIRLQDVATVTLGADDYESQVWFDGKRSVYVGIQLAPTANLLDVIGAVRAIYPDIQSALPQGLTSEIIYDATGFVNSSLEEVIAALLEALAIVAIVVFVFLGSPRSVIIPIIAIPISLVGTFVMMLAFGFTINLLTLLALVLAIGLVVDDVIIVVENVNRHMEEGLSPMEAAIKAGRELGGPIVAMTLVLIAVYVPIGFQSGLTGALFTEFAFTLAGAVTLSGVVALTLSPMMCSRLLRLRAPGELSRVERACAAFSRWFDRREQSYERRLERSLDYRPVTYTFAVLVLASIYFLYTGATSELAPQEDQGLLITDSVGAPNATLAQRELYSQQLYGLVKDLPELDSMFQIDVPGTSIGGLVLKPWDERDRNATALQTAVQADASKIAGEQVVAFQPPTLPGASGLPVQFAITTTGPFDQLNDVAQSVLAEAKKSGMFAYVVSDLKIDQPQYTVNIDRDKVALLGLTMSEVGTSLTWMLSGAYVNYFSLDGRSYRVIPQVDQRFRLTPDDLLEYYIRVADGSSVPLSTIATISTQTVPESLNHFGRLNAATIQGVPVPGVALGDVLQTLDEIAERVLPPGYRVDYGGASRQYVNESAGMLAIFGFALIIIYLALSAQFENFRDPVIILVSVPMSIAGALVFIYIGIGVSLNIYTEVGLVTLMGLISKHGILIVEFANALQAQGLSKRDAVRRAAATRLRPIIMTTAAMVLGVVPLLTASGAGAASRFNMGLVIATGISIGTMFTLFVVPAVYMLIASDRRPPPAAIPELEPVREAVPAE
ncbi:efflux RND transporter permease subunit [Marinivivus vitaminiproducens]|uniref:efflux RND transporter permease subunit n=1 Tax=Marinivivus vitaminiproducens TaxID=3035935 RepID=UPI0027A88EAB|nr:efflux RND transporter permease subunit [Geminicoccaceae bacterium SCSIO 64248]